jgi:uncharacterized cofD-like protein
VRVVCFGGGTGLATLLRGLRSRSGAGDSVDISAIVTVTDDGGSSGRLRQDFAILAPGDVRNCMVALAEDSDLLSQLFQYRFKQGDGLRGHSLGNLLLTALTDVTGDFHQAIQRSCEVLNIRGKIYPSTLSNVRLEAEMVDGQTIVGETKISGSSSGVRRIRLKPRRCKPPHEALEAIHRADVITFGPGSLYTSVIPNLLVDGIPAAVAASQASKIYICNLMGQPGESEGLSAADHVDAILAHVPRAPRSRLLDSIVVNSKKVPKQRIAAYLREGSTPVAVAADALDLRGVSVIAADLLAKGSMVRHNPERLADLIVELARAARDSPNIERP